MAMIALAKAGLECWFALLRGAQLRQTIAMPNNTPQRAKYASAI
jgi:hypothetical protein